MRITRVEVIPLDLRLTEPYTIAYETVATVQNFLIRVVTDGPHVGLGISAPDAGVTGETPAIAHAALTDVVVPVLTGADALCRAVSMERLGDALPKAPSVRAAVDMALHDLLGKAAGLPVWKMLGGYRSSIPTSITLYITDADEMVRRATDFVDQGFIALKVKGGIDVDLDVERVTLLRRVLGPGIELRFDANQGYDPAAALAFHRRTVDVGISMIEQPTPADRLAEMRQVTGSVAIPVMADESIQRLADAFRYARGDAMDMVNLKLVKVGGLDKAGMINAVARAAGLEVMVGCMDEAALSIASGVAFALSRRNVEFADLDGHLDLLDDPTAGSLRLERGVLYPSAAPGFGLTDI